MRIRDWSSDVCSSDLGDDRLMTLNRRVTIYDGFTAKLAIVDISGLKPGKLVHAEEIATLRRPLLTDNFEALAISREHGEPILRVASDDNHNFFQQIRRAPCRENMCQYG